MVQMVSRPYSLALTATHQPPGSNPTDVELAGVYAIAAGTAEGLGYEILTRAEASSIAYYACLAEMTRNGTAYGAAPLTFLTLAGSTTYSSYAARR
jgi:glycerol-3-phosphate dehydrogenase